MKRLMAFIVAVFMAHCLSYAQNASAVSDTSSVESASVIVSNASDPIPVVVERDDSSDFVKDDFNLYGIIAKENCIDSILVALNGVEHISVWRHGEVSEELNYGVSKRCGDVIVAPDLCWQFAANPKNKAGAHGYSPKEKDMQVTFIASGPYFKTVDISLEKAAFQNIDIYPMLSDMLGIRAANTDGVLRRTSTIRQ